MFHGGYAVTQQSTQDVRVSHGRDDSIPPAQPERKREVLKTWKENQMSKKNKVEWIKSETKVKCQTINHVERKQ